MCTFQCLIRLVLCITYSLGFPLRPATWLLFLFMRPFYLPSLSNIMHLPLTPSRSLPPPYPSFPSTSSSVGNRGAAPPSSSSAAAAPQTGDVTIYTPESTAQSLAHPPPKRRRAKRTEEERIDYLRADPYVAQFEAYRVLCASCDKWIRLRPNSTYCSIPWDAHRKSCLAKKMQVQSLSFVSLIFGLPFVI